MGILSIKNGFSLTDKFQRQLVQTGTQLIYEVVGFSGKTTSYMDLTVYNLRFNISFWFMNLLIHLCAKVIGFEIIGTYTVIVDYSTINEYFAGDFILIHVVTRKILEKNYYDCWINRI